MHECQWHFLFYLEVIMESYLTKEGFEALQSRLNYLKTDRRNEVAKKLQAAREMGDLSENAEYDSAKDEQTVIETEIAEIEHKLRTSKIIEENEIDTSKVSIGCMVKILDVEFNEELEYKIVGSSESDPKNKLISNESPVGSALLGKSEGDVVDVRTPSGIVKFKILSITR